MQPPYCTDFKNIIDEVKALASQPQKRDQDIFKSYSRVDGVIESIQATRINIDRDFKVWYNDILDLTGKIEITHRMKSIQRNRRNISSSHPIDQEDWPLYPRGGLPYKSDGGARRIF